MWLSEKMSRQLGEDGVGPFYSELRELEVQSGGIIPTALDRIEKSVVKIGKIVTAGEAEGEKARN